MAKVVYSRMLNDPSNAVENRNKSTQVKRKEKNRHNYKVYCYTKYDNVGLGKSVK